MGNDPRRKRMEVMAAIAPIGTEDAQSYSLAQYAGRKNRSILSSPHARPRPTRSARKTRRQARSAGEWILRAHRKGIHSPALRACTAGFSSRTTARNIGHARAFSHSRPAASPPWSAGACSRSRRVSANPEADPSGGKPPHSTSDAGSAPGIRARRASGWNPPGGIAGDSLAGASCLYGRSFRAGRSPGTFAASERGSLTPPYCHADRFGLA